MATPKEHKYGMCSTCGRGLDDISEFVLDASPVKCVMLCNECWNEYLTYSNKMKRAAADEKLDLDRTIELSRENGVLKKRIQELETQLSVSVSSSQVKLLSTDDLQYLQKQKQIIESSSDPFDENDERIVIRDGKRFRQWCSNGGMSGQLWYGEKEIPTN
jgi:hypothetical protein